jgi:hypothetical protein
MAAELLNIPSTKLGCLQAVKAEIHPAFRGCGHDVVVSGIYYSWGV